jgi:hypothetical protein
MLGNFLTDPINHTINWLSGIEWDEIIEKAWLGFIAYLLGGLYCILVYDCLPPRMLL